MSKFLKNVIIFVFSIFLSGLAQADATELKIAVMEFENNSGKTELEHFKKGIRDMLTTDISQIKGITIIERGRLDQILKEINLTQSKYFDKTQSAKIGNLLGADYLLTGSYLLESDIFRIDVRLVKVSTAEIVYTEKTEGGRSEFFDLEKNLAIAIVQKMKPNVSKKELRRVNQIQTENFASFEIYSQAIYAQEKGELAEAIDLMRKAVHNDQSFKLAQRHLAVFQELLLKKINDENSKNQRNLQSLKAKMDQDFSSCKLRCLKNDNAIEYYLSLLSVAVHEGLRSNFQAERDVLLRFWQEYSNNPQAASMWTELRLRLEKKSLFFETNLMKIEKGNEYHISFTDEAAQHYDYPRYINMWPFCYRFGILSSSKQFAKARETILKNLLPDNLFTEHCSFDYLEMRNYTEETPRSREMFRIETQNSLSPISNLRKLEIETSIMCFYLRNKALKITSKHFDSLVASLVDLIKKCSPWDSHNIYTNDIALMLIERLHFISANIKNGSDRVKIDQFILTLTKYIKGDAPGNTNEQGIKIAKLHFDGDVLVVMPFVFNNPIMQTDYRDCLIEGIKNINPNTKFNILTNNERLFNNLCSPASRKNVMKAISFIQKNVYSYGRQEYSVEQRLVQIYENCKKENIHIIILCDDGYSLENSGIIQYIMLKTPKQIKISVVFTRGNINLEQFKISAIKLLNLALRTGGKIYHQNREINISSPDEIKKEELTEKPIDADGNSLLHKAAEIDKNGDMITFLISTGLSPFEKNKQGRTAFDIARMEAKICILKYMANNENFKNFIDVDGNSLVHIASRIDRDCDLIKLFISNGFSPFIKNKQGRTAFDMYGYQGQKKILGFLANDEKFKTHTDEDGNTLLHISAQIGDREMVKLLLAKGYSPAAKNKKGETPLDISRNYEIKKEILMQMITSGNFNDFSDSAGNTLLHIAVSLRLDCELIKNIISKGYSPFEKNNQGETAFKMLYRKDQKVILRFLADNKKLKNYTDENGNTLLHLAAKINDGELIKYLISAGLFPFEKNNQGKTAFEFVQGRMRKEILIAVASNETSHKYADAEGNTLLHIVAKIDWNGELVKILLELGYSSDVRNNNGKTPKDIAKSRRVKNILEQYGKQTIKQ